jgi:hypothetical protein
MPEEKWASIEDFATLFQYFWYRDFPMDPISTGARRSDWTIHIGLVVRQIADLIGFVARFESGKRKDAVIKNTEQDIIALEWEWDEKWGNEIDKLKKAHRIWSEDKNNNRLLKYAVFITYRPANEIADFYKKVLDEWKESSFPLLLILFEEEQSTEFYSGREFKDLFISKVYKGERQELRSSPALRWKVPKTRWSREEKFKQGSI